MCKNKYKNIRFLMTFVVSDDDNDEDDDNMMRKRTRNGTCNIEHFTTM